MPRISIITPAYNAEAYIEACAHSVLGQTFSDFEWIVINDGSSDSTLEKINAIAAGDARVNVLSQANQGVSATRNLGLAQAAGDYFAFIDADDLWHPQLLELSLQALEKSGADLVSFTLVETPENFVLPTPLKPQELKKLRSYAPITALKKNHAVQLMFCNKLYKKSLMANRFPTHLKQGEDHDYTWTVFSQATKVARIANTLYYYRLNPAGATQQAPAKDRFDCAYYLAKTMKQHYVDSPAFSPATKRWIYKRIASMCFKTFVLKVRRVKDTEIKAAARRYLHELTQDGIFRAQYLPIRKRLLLRKYSQPEASQTH